MLKLFLRVRQFQFRAFEFFKISMIIYVIQKNLITIYKKKISSKQNINREMSHKKVWKEFSYIKNEQQRDSQSEISESRSSRSYHFNKVKFSKSRQNIQTSTKKFGLANIIKIKDNSRQNSLINESMIKKGQTSFIQKMERPSLPSNLKSKKNRKVQLKMQKFLYDVRKIHDSLKNMAENILSSFEKIKDQLETNLLLVIDQLLKAGNNIKHQQKIHEVIHKSFSQMKRNISILPCSLTHLNSSREEQLTPKNNFELKIPTSPIQKPFNESNQAKSRTKIHSIFSPKQTSPYQTFELPISSSQKVRARPQTERKTHSRFGSFNNNVSVKEFPQTPLISKREKQKGKSQFLNLEKPSGIQSIINQMRSILNQ